MGLLSFRLKPVFLGLLKSLNRLHFFIIFFSLINLSVCIYEDQIGKFDWRQNYVGRIKFAQFDTAATAKRIIAATEENVLAALNLKTGQVVWRQMMESAAPGTIQFLHVSEQVLTVTGNNPYIIRGWDSNTGILIWEWSLSVQDEIRAKHSQWQVHNGLLVHLLPVFGSHLEVTMYDMVTGTNRGLTSKLPAGWVNERCVLSKSYYTCISGSQDSQILSSIDITSNAIQLINRPIAEHITSKFSDRWLRPFGDGSVIPGFVIDDKKLLLIENNEFKLLDIDLSYELASVVALDSNEGAILLQIWQDLSNNFNMKALSLSTLQSVFEVQTPTVDIPNPEVAAALCTGRDQLACRILVKGEDDSFNLVQQAGRVLWTREEALARVESVTFVDLPISETDAAIESEFTQKGGSIWAAFTRRLHSQWLQLNTLINSVTNRDFNQGSGSSLVRDYFNLHKVIVLVTRSGKVFGMDNVSGELLWRRYFPQLDTSGMAVYLRRSVRHIPHQAYLSIVGKDKVSGNGLIISMNPLTGSLIGEKVLELDYKLQQCAMLHEPDAEHLQGLLLLDQNDNVQVLPISSAPLVQDMFMFVADKTTTDVKGYALLYDGKSVNAIKTWSINLSGHTPGHRIVRILPKHPEEKVHSPGKVMGDRSVLYKYLNPNLVLFVTEGPDAVHKDVVCAWLVDVVSGAVVFSQQHRRARATPHAVHSDNFLAYVYINDRQRRTEVASLELFSGPERWSGAFRSLGGERSPHVWGTALVLPAAPRALAATRTARGITDVYVLVSLSSGTTVSVPWWGASRSESPALVLPSDSALTYNLTVLTSGLHVEPSGLESTCLVLATGLDLFYTRVAPSKTFDVLKDDFDYFLISIVLVGLIVASYVSKYFATRKLLKQGWK